MPRPLDDYVEVAERIERFYDKYPQGSLRCKEIRTVKIGDADFLVYVAQAFRDPEDEAPAEGSAWEPVPGKTNFTRDSELMNAETSAWGRAIAALGFEVKRGIASKQEVMNRRDADGGGESTRSPAVNGPVGFVSEKQRKFYDRVLKNPEWGIEREATVTRYLDQAPKATVSAAIDALKEGSDAEREGLLNEAANWAAQQTDIPLDEDA